MTLQKQIISFGISLQGGCHIGRVLGIQNSQNYYCAIILMSFQFVAYLIIIGYNDFFI